MSDEIVYPRYILCKRGMPYVHRREDGTEEGRCTVETMAFFTLDEFKAYAEKDHVLPSKVVGLYLLGEPLDVSASKVVVEVEKHEWSVPAEA